MKHLMIGTIAMLAALACGAPAVVAAQGAAAAPSERDKLFYNIANYMGMLRGTREVDAVATIELWGEGTIDVGGQPCRLTKYNASINYQTPGMRVDFSCTRPDGQAHHDIQVVSGGHAWNEVGAPGAGLVAGQGTAVPAMETVPQRLARLWSGPQGVVKAARMGGENTKITVEGGKTVLTFPIPGVSGGTARATLSARYQAEQVEVRIGQEVTEWTYSNYGDHNEPDIKLDVFFAGRMVQKRGGATLLDLTITKTDTANPYVVMPVPANVRRYQ